MLGVWRCLLENKQESFHAFFVNSQTSNQEWRRHPTKQMDKLLKYLMLLLVTTFSFTFTACGGDDDKDEPKKPDDISTVGQLNTVTAKLETNNYGDKHSAHVTVDVGCSVFLSGSGNSSLYLYVVGGGILYAGDFNQLSSITTTPTTGWTSPVSLKNRGCYIIHSNTGAYIRLKAELNADASEVTFTFQTYQPTNII